MQPPFHCRGNLRARGVQQEVAVRHRSHPVALSCGDGPYSAEPRAAMRMCRGLALTGRSLLINAPEKKKIYEIVDTAGDGSSKQTMVRAPSPTWLHPGRSRGWHMGFRSLRRATLRTPGTVARAVFRATAPDHTRPHTHTHTHSSSIGRRRMRRPPHAVQYPIVSPTPARPCDSRHAKPGHAVVAAARRSVARAPALGARPGFRQRQPRCGEFALRNTAERTSSRPLIKLHGAEL